MVDGVLAASMQQNSDNVKPCVGVMQLLFREPGQRRLGNLALFERGHRQLRHAVGQPGAGLDLDEDQALVPRITGNDVNLAPLAAEVALHDPVAARDQEICRNLFAQFAGTFVARGCGGRGGGF